MTVTYIRRDGWRFRWNGSKTVNVYRSTGENVDVFSLDYGREWSDEDWRDIQTLCDEWGTLR